MNVEIRAKDGTLRGVVLLDEEDAHFACHKWHVSQGGYARRSLPKEPGKTRVSLFLHREILGLDTWDGRETDHINGNRLDNQRSNLRVVSKAQNRQNNASYKGSTSKYRGVSWWKRGQRWRAQAQVAGKGYWIGTFTSEIAAAKAAAAFRKEHMAYAVGSRDGC